MKADVRDTPRFAEIEQRFSNWLRPGQGLIAELLDAAASPLGDVAVGTAVVCEALRGAPSTRIVQIDLEDGATMVLTHGPNSDRSPRWSPDGATIAFLSDRDQPFLFQPYILDLRTGVERAIGGVQGFVEYHHWSADGRRLLLGVAGLEADLAGAQGGFSVAQPQADRADWMPHIESGAAAGSWRSVWIHDLETGKAARVSPDGVNIWEATWCGDEAFVAICSDAPGEEAWYRADLRHFPLDGGAPRTLLTPSDQLGWLSATPSGARVAVVEAVCSDRTIVAGDLRLVDVQSGVVHRPDAEGGDVTATAWRGEDHLLATALRGPENLILLHDRLADATRMLWVGRDRTPGGLRFPEVFALGSDPEACLFLREGWFERPTLVELRAGQEREIRQFGAETLQRDMEALGQARSVTWQAPDGLDIHGWLLTPPGDGPHGLVMNIHGGPVWMLRPRYLGKHFMHQALLAAGFAVLDVNPRGSSGRGQAFARQVFGDMGGADAQDFLSGLDHLVAEGLADPKRLGVTGGSYGGYMSSWLITQDQRFAAAVPVAPVTDWVSEHLTCHIPYFCEVFLNDDIDNASGKYFTRSPIHYASRVITPTLNICGALDKNTPPGQALEFHHALLRHGVQSALLTYPQEGHGIRQMPALFDYLTRLVDWFVEHMPADRRA